MFKHFTDGEAEASSVSENLLMYSHQLERAELTLGLSRENVSCFLWFWVSHLNREYILHLCERHVEMWGWGGPTACCHLYTSSGSPTSQLKPLGIHKPWGTSSSKAFTHLGKGRPATCGLCAVCELAERVHLMVATLSDGHGTSPPQTQENRHFCKWQEPGSQCEETEFSMLPLVTARQDGQGAFSPAPACFWETVEPRPQSSGPTTLSCGELVEDSWRATLLSFCVTACLLGVTSGRLLNFRPSVNIC